MQSIYSSWLQAVLNVTSVKIVSRRLKEIMDTKLKKPNFVPKCVYTHVTLSRLASSRLMSSEIDNRHH